jgi:hypothetical protein
MPSGSHTSFMSTETPILQDHLTPIQNKLLLKHYQMGHLNMTKIQQLAKEGIFGASFSNIATCNPPLCKACIHRKQHKQPIISAQLQPLDSTHLTPGDCISGDQLESTQPALIPTFKDSPTTSFYHARTLLVDHTSRLSHFTPHTSTGAKEASSAKHQFELFASSFNRPIKKYHADNGIFASKLFCDSCQRNHQQLSFCGVDAHHQNGIAECYICTIMEHAQTMLINAMIHWPEIIQESFWPYAIQLAVDIHNSTPTQWPNSYGNF